ncbi:MAG: hypothetical protein LBJ31_08280 [Treponema sp.]|jgi:hypothetical protein|nr:hypothetical protein [Treponema sp.]
MVYAKPALNSSLKERFFTTQTANSGPAEAFFCPQKGVRYLNPQTSLWLSADPAMGEYIPGAPINDEARERNRNLPGMGGVFNYVNLHAYHYAGNNPVKYTDPDGERDISVAEAAFIKEILGDTGVKAIRKAKIYRSPLERAGSTRALYYGQIFLKSIYFASPLSSYEGREELLHEAFHQVQEMIEPGGIAFGMSLVGPTSAVDKLVHEQGLYNKGIDVYAPGDYTVVGTDLSRYSKLADLPYYESRAQLIGKFASLYSRAKDGIELNPYEKRSLRDMARIMSNSRITSEAIKWVNENY